ncbi:MAG TPA: hypothetical protein VMU72_11265 [Gaiellaceae bacterium]|nr:hypothetical protein [Gaiellaceae bacterium]
MSRAEQRARRLLRWYPRAWRERYGDEFSELLRADIEERPRSWSRAFDVARRGAAARLGLGGTVHSLPARERAGARLAAFVAAGSAFVVFGTAIWAQLAIGWQWSRPSTPATSAAIVAMSCLLASFAALAALGVVPVLWTIARRLASRCGQGLAVPFTVFLAGTAVSVLGARHFAAGWPGTGGHPWARQHLLPGHVAALAWAETLSVTSYWAHPRALLGFPPDELLWMAASPVALVAAVAGGARTIRRLELSPRVLRFELALARLACGAMIAFVAAACCWIAAGGTGPRNLFHVGAIDFAAVGAMVAALLVARRAGADARAALGQ